MKKIILIILISFCLLSAVSVVQASPDDALTQLKATAEDKGANFGEARDVRYVVAYIIQIALSIVGILFVIYLVYGGFLLVTSGGNEEAVQKAKRTILYAIIGVLIVLASYSISLLVGSYFGKITSEKQQEYGEYGEYGGVDVRIKEDQNVYDPYDPYKNNDTIFE